MRLGIDVGSTTVKLVLIDDNGKILYQRLLVPLRSRNLFRRQMWLSSLAVKMRKLHISEVQLNKE